MNYWERVQEDDRRETLRMQVPGGWLYYVLEFGHDGPDVGHQLVFVPNPEKAP